MKCFFVHHNIVIVSAILLIVPVINEVIIMKREVSFTCGRLATQLLSTLAILSLAVIPACTIPDSINPGFIPGIPSIPGNPKIPVKPLIDPLIKKQQEKICDKSGGIQADADAIINGSQAGNPDNPACAAAAERAGQARQGAIQACNKANACAAIKKNKQLRDQCFQDAKALNDEAQELLNEAEELLAQCLADTPDDTGSNQELSYESKSAEEIDVLELAEPTSLLDAALELVLVVYDQLEFTSRPELVASYDGAVFVGVADILGFQDTARVVVYAPDSRGVVRANYTGLGAAGLLIGISQQNYHSSWDQIESNYDTKKQSGKDDVCYLVGTFNGGPEHMRGSSLDFCDDLGAAPVAK